MNVNFLCRSLLAALLGAGFGVSPALAASAVRHDAEVRLEPASRHIEVTDEIELEAADRPLRFRLSKLPEAHSLISPPLGASGFT